MAVPFLTAEWRFVVMLNYEVDAALLQGMVPPGTEIDLFEGRCYVSLVGFRFERARVKGLWIPLHSDFDEVNLRFYVLRRVGGDVRRGVAFVREIVPRWAIAQVARSCYGENYVALPMRHQVIEPTSEGGRIQAEYGWRHAGRWARLRAEGKGSPTVPPNGSAESFFAEHYWGYTSAGGATQEYRVEHDRWRTWHATAASFEGDVDALYGREIAGCLKKEPSSALIAEGSAVTVYGAAKCDR